MIFNMFRRAYAYFSKISEKEVIEAELHEATLLLLQYRSSLELTEAMVQYNQKRVDRLTEGLKLLLDQERNTKPG
jgi:hypothetical protein